MGFWENFDKVNKKELKELCDDLKIDYLNFKNQRHLNRIPKVKQIIMLSKYLNCSIDYLLTGKDFSPLCSINPKYNKLIKTLESKLILWTDEDLVSFQNIINKMV